MGRMGPSGTYGKLIPELMSYSHMSHLSHTSHHSLGISFSGFLGSRLPRRIYHLRKITMMVAAIINTIRMIKRAVFPFIRGESSGQKNSRSGATISRRKSIIWPIFCHLSFNGFSGGSMLQSLRKDSTAFLAPSRKVFALWESEPRKNLQPQRRAMVIMRLYSGRASAGR